MSADLCFGGFLSNEVAVTVNLGNADFPGLKLAPLVTKLLSVFPSTCFPEVGPRAKEFSSLDSVLAQAKWGRACSHPSAQSLSPPSLAERRVIQEPWCS